MDDRVVIIWPEMAVGNGGNDVADPARGPQAVRLLSLCAVRRVEDHHVLLASANDELKGQRDVSLKHPCATDARALSGERLRRRPCWTRHRGLT